MECPIKQKYWGLVYINIDEIVGQFGERISFNVEDVIRCAVGTNKIPCRGFSGCALFISRPPYPAGLIGQAV